MFVHLREGHMVGAGHRPRGAALLAKRKSASSPSSSTRCVRNRPMGRKGMSSTVPDASASRRRACR